MIDTSNKEFQDAASLIQYTRQSVFLTGKAGTGKSTFLKYICEHTRKKHVVLAPTGIAAINAGGCTMHSFFKLPFHPLLPDDPQLAVRGGRLREFLKYSKEHCRLIKELELVIIDEISMVRADIIDFIDKVLRVYSGNMREPFGGKQMLLVGDVYQLEPVVKQDERDILRRFYPAPFFFCAHVFEQFSLVSIELTKVYRQSDKVFVDVLNHIRTNTATAADLQLLNTRYTTSETPSSDELRITLATRRDTVDFINQQKLDSLPNEPTVLKGSINGEFPESSLPTQLQLEVKPGAQVIFIKNDREHRWVNGTLGTITCIGDDNTLFVMTEQGEEYEVEQEKWSNIRYHYNEMEKRIEEEELGVFIQFPIRLAWAITVHKSQGLTFSRVTIDFSGGVFAGGQTYVALSRCTSLDGICLRAPLNRSDVFVRPEIVTFAKQFNDEQAYARAMKQAQADVEYRQCAEDFDRGDFESCLNHLFLAIHARYDIEKPAVKRLIRCKLGVINKLKMENEELRNHMQQQCKNLERYAKEYYVMGNDCITQAHNPKAAIANYDKAIELNPKYVDAYVRKGITLYNQQDYYPAMQCLNEAVRLSDRSYKAYYNRGKCRFAMNDLEGAVGDFEMASKLKKDHPAAYQQLGDVYQQMGDEEKAALYHEIARRLKDRP